MEYICRLGKEQMKKSLNDIAKYEVAISKKYGKEAIQHPKAEWTDEKEKDYQHQIRELHKKEVKDIINIFDNAGAELRFVG